MHFLVKNRNGQVTTYGCNEQVFFRVKATLENDNHTQMKRLNVHAYCLERLVMLLLISHLRIIISTILYWAWFRYIGLDTTTSREVPRVMTYTRQMCLTCVWSSVMRSAYYQYHIQFLLVPCNILAVSYLCRHTYYFNFGLSISNESFWVGLLSRFGKTSCNTCILGRPKYQRSVFRELQLKSLHIIHWWKSWNLV